jgi:hypothetical protein
MSTTPFLRLMYSKKLSVSRTIDPHRFNCRSISCRALSSGFIIPTHLQASLPERQTVAIAGRTFRYERHVPPPTDRPVHLTGFLHGSIIECVVDDAYAFTCRAYDYRTGSLAANLRTGTAKLRDLKIKIPSP